MIIFQKNLPHEQYKAHGSLKNCYNCIQKITIKGYKIDLSIKKRIFN